MLNKGAISLSPFEKDQFISDLFLVKKKNGKFRPVINLKGLNQFIKYHHFKMDTLDYILQGIGKNNYFCSLDLKDAYFSIPIHKSYRRFFIPEYIVLWLFE